MELGGFFCTCAKTSNVNYNEIGKALKGKLKPFVVQDLLCTGEGQAHIVDYARRGLIDAALIGCTEKVKIFEELGERIALPFYYVNLREHCGWVHNSKDATEKGKRMIAARAAEIEASKEVLPHTVNVGAEILFVGSSPEIFEAARKAARAAEVKVVAEKLAGNDGGVNVVLGRVKSISGEIGSFRVLVELNPISLENCISCGKCVEICSRKAIFPAQRHISEECDVCGRCRDICPANAIDFYRSAEEIRTGQIVILGSEAKRKAGIYNAHDANSLEAAALEALSNTGSIIKPLAIEADLSTCASGKSRVVGCTLCESACAHEAIIRSGDKISFSAASCDACGACAAACPISLPQFKLMPSDAVHAQMEALLQGEPEKKVVLFACEKDETLARLGAERRSYYPVLPVFVPCLSALSELEILRAFDLGAGGVVLLGCGNCLHGEAYKSAVDFSQNILQAFNLDGRLLVLQSSEPMIFVSEVQEFVGSLPAGVKRGGSLSFKNKRQGLLEIFRRLSTEAVPETIEAPSFGIVEVGSKCTLCSTCSVICPQEAIRKDGDALAFVHSRCIACGLCENSCPEKAVTLRKAIDFRKLFGGEVVVFRGEVLSCPACGKATISKNALQNTISRLGKRSVDAELLKFCPSCRALKALGLIEGD